MCAANNKKGTMLNAVTKIVLPAAILIQKNGNTSILPKVSRPHASSAVKSRTLILTMLSDSYFAIDDVIGFVRYLDIDDVIGLVAQSLVVLNDGVL